MTSWGEADMAGSVAVWYLRNDEPRLAIVDDESAAVAFALKSEIDGQPVLGFQTVDGRTVDRADWAALDQAWDQHRRLLAELASGQVVKPDRSVQLPFGDHVARVPAAAPQWISAEEGTENGMRAGSAR